MHKSDGRVVAAIALTLVTAVGCGDGHSVSHDSLEQVLAMESQGVEDGHRSLSIPPEATGHRSHKVPALDLDPSQDAFPAGESFLKIGSWMLDRSAFVGLPRSFADDATKHVSEALEVVGLDKGPQRIKYERVDRRDGDAVFPLDVASREAGTEAVPIVLLPSPDVLRGVLEWSQRHAWGDLQEFRTLESLDWDSPSVRKMGRTVFFAPGPSSESQIRTPPLPYGTQLSAGIFKYSSPHLSMGKIVMNARDRNVAQTLKPLKLGKRSGATLIGRLTTIPLSPENDRLRLVRLDVPDPQQTRTWIACTLSDANGVRRGQSHLQPDGTSSFERPLASPSHDPMVGRHSLLRIPRPLDLQSRNAPHEEIAIDERFFRSGASGVVLAAESGSKPFREALVLVTDPEKLSSGDRLLLIGVFAQSSPAELVRFIQACAESPDSDPS